jgi:hypothetical protein
MRRLSSVFVALLAALAAGLVAASPALAAPQDVQVGQVRATQANTRNGTALHAEPRHTANRVAALAYGTMVRVDRIQPDGWMQVTVVPGGATTGVGATGWMKVAQSVEPALLGPRDQVAVAREGARNVRAEQVSAAGRRLLGTQQRHAVTSADLARGYPIVDRLEQANEAVAPESIDAFIQQGRLGRRGQ